MFVPNGIATGASVLVNCAVQLGLLAEAVGAMPSRAVPAKIVATARDLVFRTSYTSLLPGRRDRMVPSASREGKCPLFPLRRRGKYVTGAATNPLVIDTPALSRT